MLELQYNTKKESSSECQRAGAPRLECWKFPGQDLNEGEQGFTETTKSDALDGIGFCQETSKTERYIYANGTNSKICEVVNLRISLVWSSSLSQTMSFTTRNPRSTLQTPFNCKQPTMSAL